MSVIYLGLDDTDPDLGLDARGIEFGQTLEIGWMVQSMHVASNMARNQGLEIAEMQGHLAGGGVVSGVGLTVPGAVVQVSSDGRVV